MRRKLLSLTSDLSPSPPVRATTQTSQVNEFGTSATRIVLARISHMNH